MKKKFKDFSCNIKKTWDTIRELLGRKKHKIDIPDFFRLNGQTLIGSKNIAQSFNNFFANIGPELARSIESTN